MTLSTVPSRLVFFALLCLFAAGQLPAQLPAGRPVPESATGKINSARSKEHITIIASDAMMGRNTPSLELEHSAEYIIGKLREYGVEPVGDGYRHGYKLKRETLGAPNLLRVNGKPFELKTGFVPYEFSGSGEVAGDVVFVGFGISQPKNGYDDYAGVDVQGKIVLAIAGEPKGLKREAGVRLSLDPGSRGKMQLAASKGAVGFLLLPNPSKSRYLKPLGFPWPSLYKGVPESALPIKLDLPSTGTPIPSVSIGGDVAREIFGTSSIEEIAGAVRKIDSTGVPASSALKSRAEMVVTLDKTIFGVHNVVGMVRGSQIPDEYVVVGAHYDHVGHFQSTSAKDATDTIYNGADDNGSGTTGLLLMAEAFASLPAEQRPARSILFIWFSGEEKGLYGSRAYVANPLIPNEKSVAMLNMDMIGRNDPDTVAIAGKTRSRDMIAFAEAANRIEPMTIVDSLDGESFESMFYRSDQASFAAKRIPVLFFSSGLHDDYHQVTDSHDKINTGKLAHIARLCFRTAWMIADAPVRPVYDGEEEKGTSMMFMMGE